MTCTVPFCIQDWIKVVKQCQAAREKSPDNFQDTPLEDQVLENVHPSQVPHLRDWAAVNALPEGLQRAGKEIFFSNKTFAMDGDFSRQMQELQVSNLTSEDQQIALRCIRHVVYIIQSAHTPSKFVAIYPSLSKFTNLKRLDMLFVNLYEVLDTAFIVEKPIVEETLWPEFIDALEAVGFGPGKVQFTVYKVQEDIPLIIINGEREAGLEKYPTNLTHLLDHVYAMLVLRARLIAKARQNAFGSVSMDVIDD
ncbi:uncharacterized protein ACLA_063400 [Aspergillus clavatus NRRL 1]|uniref:Uncharacterized protein n=1 Tax=Aspergillus clavatus (strain ATCC 1007 / CBS 513.65 / DSM 816 / NCTC 3887 / NRRL 1 / QM 1276 / 107) TaxID=344612 RepID=A1CCW6_ASPCL|nr:uncharacterized protein ACLA_063400 [Aspergillus clavatus NRRL 1]EAW12373.1 hypothetical protein ACLA_063400 [Aspergillus clavatus NRRL 1]